MSGISPLGGAAEVPQNGEYKQVSARSQRDWLSYVRHPPGTPQEPPGAPTGNVCLVGM
jgi:hypothetical protein